MKVKVIQEFRDKFNYNKVFEVGNVYEFEDARAKDILARKLGVEDKVKEVKPKKKKDDQ